MMSQTRKGSRSGSGLLLVKRMAGRSLMRHSTISALEPSCWLTKLMTPTASPN